MALGLQSSKSSNITVPVILVALAVLLLASANSVVLAQQQCSGAGQCPTGTCCSQYGFCGDTAEYCAPNAAHCQADCWSSDSGPSNNAAQMCGNGVTGTCMDGSCCSQFGFCGSTEVYCSPINNCFSNCWTNVTMTTTTATTAAVPTSASPSTTTATTTTAMPSTTTTAARTTTTTKVNLVQSILNGLLGGLFGRKTTTTTTTKKATTTTTTKTTAITTPTSAVTATAHPNPPQPASTSVPDSVENPDSDARGVYSSCRVKGTWALTFDDGPSNVTHVVLDALAAANVKATFFVVGSMIDSDPAYAAVMTRAFNEGHMIASHTYTHADLATLTHAQIVSEMQRASDAIYRVLGVRPRYMRPPYGSLNEQAIATLTTELGYRVMMWNFDTLDWQDRDANTLISKVTDQLSQYSSQAAAKSFVSLMHDLYDSTAAAQPTVLQLIQHSPFRFVTMSQCLNDPYPYL